MTPLKLSLSILLMGTMHSCNNKSENATSVSVNANVLLAPCDGLYGGVLPFNNVKIDDFKAALESAMNKNLEAVEEIASNTAAVSGQQLMT